MTDARQHRDGTERLGEPAPLCRLGGRDVRRDWSPHVEKRHV